MWLYDPYLSGLINQAGLLKIFLMQSSVEMYVVLHSNPTQQKPGFTVLINEESSPGFCLSHQLASVSTQPYTYLHMEESSKLRNVVLIPNVSNKSIASHECRGLYHAV